MDCSRQLKAIRIKNNLTQQHLADALGVSRSTYCGYEIGRRLIDVDTLVKLARFYKLDINSFIERFDIMAVNEDVKYEQNDDIKYLSQLSKKEADLVAKYRVMSDDDKKELSQLAKSKIRNQY